MVRKQGDFRRAWLYVGSGRAASLEATRVLARGGAIWTPGPFLPTPDPGVEPGDEVVLLWRAEPASPVAALLGAARVAAPTRPWGGRAWVDTVGPDDPAFAESLRLGYRGPRNYRAMARLAAWTEDVREIRRRTQGAIPLVDPGGLVSGVPAEFLVALEPGMLTAAPRDSADPLLERIVVDPRVLGGKPIVRGLRIAVEHVLSWLAAGSSVEEIVAELPELETEDIRACLQFAARRVAGERIDPALRAG